MFAGSVNPVCSHSTPILIQVEHLTAEKYSSLCGFALIYSIPQQMCTEVGDEDWGEIIRCGTGIEKKTERGLHLHFNLSFKMAWKHPTTASVKAACQGKKEKTGGDRRRSGLVWNGSNNGCDKSIAVLPSNCRQKRKGVEQEWGGCDNLQLSTCLCFATRFLTTRPHKVELVSVPKNCNQETKEIIFVTYLYAAPKGQEWSLGWIRCVCVCVWKSILLVSLVRSV